MSEVVGTVSSERDEAEDEKKIDEDETNNKNNKSKSPSSSSASSIQNVLLNVDADRFIPYHKRSQWDNIPKLIIAIQQSYLIDSQMGDEFQTLWVRNINKRTSHLEPCLFNILHQIPETKYHFQMCHNSRCFPAFNSYALEYYYASIVALQQNILQQQGYIRKLGYNLQKSKDDQRNSTRTSIHTMQNILALYKPLIGNSSYQPFDSRTIQTTPETLAQLCDAIHKTSTQVEMGRPSPALTVSGAMCMNVQTILELVECQKLICQDYLIKTNMLIDIERLQGMEDIKAYDMYSCQFECIEIPPPRETRLGPNCSGCFPGGIKKKKHKPCYYHRNLSLSSQYKNRGSFRILETLQGPKKPAIVQTKDQFFHLHETLRQMRENSGCIIGYLHVAGVAENRPLVNIGDLLRFRFGKEEVVGEVLNVTIKTETVMVVLPMPAMNDGECIHFIMSLTSPKNRPNYRVANPKRFDVRFGLFPSRAHDIFKDVAFKATQKSINNVTRILTPSLFLEGVQKKSDRRLQIGISEWKHNLNPEQKHAVFDIVRRNHGAAPYIIYGPPGTGKTMTVVESVIQILRHEANAKILVCAPSDAACDVVTQRLLPALPKKHKLLRVNWWARKYDSLPPQLLRCSLTDEKGFFVMPRRSDIMGCSVIVCQCFVAGFLDIHEAHSTNEENSNWLENFFNHVFIDESSQSFEFESLIPLFKVNKKCSIILSGDPKQLGPTTRSGVAASHGLSLSLQERLMGLSLYNNEETDYAVITKLLDNYRSHDALLRIPSELFYKGSLRCKASPEITSVCKDFELLRNGHKFPLMGYGVPNGIERSKIDTPSFYNMEECEAIASIIKALRQSPNVKINTGQIAVITCFRAQVLKLREVLREMDLGGVNVGVVEDFQGQETSVVLISTVLTKDQTRWKTGSKSGLGFMTDPKRFNVAITRASALCIIVGHMNFLQSSGSYWSSLIEHIKNNGGMSRNDRDKEDQESGEFDDYLEDYGIDSLLNRIEELQLLGAGHEYDRYDLAMRGYYDDAPEWKVCL